MRPKTRPLTGPLARPKARDRNLCQRKQKAFAFATLSGNRIRHPAERTPKILKSRTFQIDQKKK